MVVQIFCDTSADLGPICCGAKKDEAAAVQEIARNPVACAR
jgi:hypothetical protein